MLDQTLNINTPNQKKFKTYQVINTSMDNGDRLSIKESGEFKTSGSSDMLKIFCDTDKPFQEILGFGGALTESAAYALNQVVPEKREEVLKAYFSPKEGIGYTFCRTHINSCDFSLGNYSCDDTKDDLELKDFTIERDRKHIIPLIKDAIRVKGSGLKMIVSPWSPPAWMKTNGEMNNGGKLKDEYRDVWARFYIRFIKEYEKEGLPTWGISVQNEPMAVQTWDSCIYTSEEERDFIRDYLGPALVKEGYSGIKILAWDHNRDIIYERAKTIFNDLKAAKYVWGTAFHWYSGPQFDQVKRVFEEFPGKKLIFTEGCIEKGVKLGQWDRGEIYAANMIGDFNAGLSTWIDWNIVLDQHGGPNHVNNFCDAPVVADSKTGLIHYQSSFYYIGHFSRYIKPGANRIGCHIEGNTLKAAAFNNPDNSAVSIVMNDSDHPVDFVLCFSNKGVPLRINRHSIMTVIAQ